MIVSPMIFKWLQENLNRLFKKSPKFFLVWNIITGVLMMITWIPEILDFFNIELPMLFGAKVNKAVGWAATGFMLASQLTTSSTPVAKTEDGKILKTVDEDKLPFTVAQEQKKVEKSEEKLPEVNVVDK